MFNFMFMFVVFGFGIRAPRTSDMPSTLSHAMVVWGLKQASNSVEVQTEKPKNLQKMYICMYYSFLLVDTHIYQFLTPPSFKHLYPSTISVYFFDSSFIPPFCVKVIIG